MTDKEKIALAIISSWPGLLGVRPSDFASIYFDTPENRHLIDALSNQGNGACYGKKAWRAAGCFLGKLKKKGLVKNVGGRYSITELGRKALESIVDDWVL